MFGMRGMRGMSTMRQKIGMAGALALTVTSLGCSDPVGFVEGPNLSVVTTDGVKFMTQRTQPDVVMDALYTGVVDISFDGCLRADATNNQATIIWPVGYELVTTTAGHEIRRPSGELLGMLGDSFELGGGQTSELSAAAGFSATDQQIAANECPGLLWIVGEVP